MIVQRIQEKSQKSSQKKLSNPEIFMKRPSEKPAELF
jgi:hypothetical protein